MGNLVPALSALIPSVGVGALFYLALRAIIRADRNERLALARQAAADQMRSAARADESPSREESRYG